MRKTIDVTITDEGRDKGKTFVLTEMPASQAEKLGQRMAFAIMRATTGDGAGFEALMDEVMACVKFKVKDRPDIPPRQLVEEDIEEIATRVQLRREVADLHEGFYYTDALSRLTSGRAPEGSSNTPTSADS